MHLGTEIKCFRELLPRCNKTRFRVLMRAFWPLTPKSQKKLFFSIATVYDVPMLSQGQETLREHT